jgi:putative toxin-antitoxin system antitoxin component (TIGR02293 family)
MGAIWRYTDDRCRVCQSEEVRVRLSEISGILGGRNVLRGDVASRMDMIELSNRGISKDALLRLASYLSLSIGQMAELLPVSERTIQRYTRKQRFNPATSEQILEIAEVAVRGAEVFGERGKFLSWMRSPCPALGNRTPASLLRSRFGTEVVLDELGRIEHGVIS